MKCGRRTAFLEYLLILVGFLAPMVAGTGEAFGPCSSGTVYTLAATVDYNYILSTNYYGLEDSTMVLTEQQIRDEFGSSFNFGPQRNTYASDCSFVVTAPSDYYVRIEIITLGGPVSRRDNSCSSNHIIISGTTNFGNTEKLCAISKFRDTRSFIPAGSVSGELAVGNDKSISCSTSQGQSVDITVESIDASSRGAIYSGFVLAYRAVKGKDCGLCVTEDGSSCIFNSMEGGNFYDEAPEQCSHQINGQTFSQPQCYTDIENDAIGACNTTNDFCEQTCITSTRGDSCFTEFEFDGKQAEGCLEKDIVDGSNETTKVCPVWRDPSTGAYTNFQPCQDPGGLCPVDYCFSNPCQNSGNCTNNGTEDKGYKCDCTEEWLGHDCNIENECFKDICNGDENNCSVVDNGDGVFIYSCTCNNGYSGNYCEIPHACVDDPCQNDGTCVLDQASESGYACDCVSPYMGDNCEFTDQCVTSKPCKNDAICFTKVNGTYLCECVNSWVGDQCAQHPEILLECGASSMAVVASLNVINSLTHSGEEIHLLDESCTFDQNETHYSTEISYQTCGTIVSVESASDVTFFQEISASRGDGFQSSGFSTALVCQVRASSNADVNYKRIEHIPAQISYHNDVFPISLNAFVSSASSGKLSPATSPLKMYTNEPIYMSISTSVAHQDAQLILKQCWCTNVSEPTTIAKYTLYEQKCPVDSTFQITTVYAREVYFEFLSFRFENADYDSSVFIHCSAFLCTIGEADCTNDAAESCGSNSGESSRKRRAVVKDPNIKSRTLTSSFGPIVTTSRQLSGSHYQIVRDDPNAKPGSGLTFTNNFDSALKVYRYYLSENLLYILVVMALLALVLAVITPNLNQRQRILTCARNFMTV